MRKIQLIVNGHASQAHRNRKAIKKLLSNPQYKSIVLNFVEKPEQLDSTLKKAIEAEPGVIMIGGGDGTIISLSDTARSLGYDGPFAILPLGTSNYLARNLSIPLDTTKAIKLALKGSPVDAHFAQANGSSFALYASVGIGTKTAEDVNVDKKKRLGQFAYVHSFIKQLNNHRSFDYSISSPELSETLSGTSHQILVANSRLNEQIKLVPDSKIDTEKLILVVYNSGANILSSLLSLVAYTLSFGKIKHGIDTYEIKKLTIETSPQQNYSLDGEILPKKKLTVNSSKKPVPILAPAQK